MDVVEETPTKRQVEFADAQALANRHAGEAFEVSAKTGAGVADVFDAVVRLSIRRTSLDQPSAHDDAVAVGAGSSSQPSRCC